MHICYKVLQTERGLTIDDENWTHVFADLSLTLGGSGGGGGGGILKMQSVGMPGAHYLLQRSRPASEREERASSSNILRDEWENWNTRAKPH